MFHLSRFASQGNPVFYTFLASPALFHPNLFGAYRHVGQECCDWFSEVGTLHRQPTKLGGSGGIGPHSEGIAYSGIMPCHNPLDPFIRELDICPRAFSLGHTHRGREGIWHHAPAFSTPFIRELDICPKTNISGQIVRTQPRRQRLGSISRALWAIPGHTDSSKPWSIS